MDITGACDVGMKNGPVIAAGMTGTPYIPNVRAGTYLDSTNDDRIEEDFGNLSSISKMVFMQRDHISSSYFDVLSQSPLLHFF